jgi:hypothetical protein
MQQAVLKSLSNTGEAVTQYSIDLTGPILPFHIHRLCNLFKSSQNGAFEMTATTLDHSPAFNSTKPNITNLKESNIDHSEYQSIKNGVRISGSTKVVSSISLQNGSYRCS